MKTRTTEYTRTYEEYLIDKKLKKLESGVEILKAKIDLNNIIEYVNNTEEFIKNIQESFIFNDDDIENLM